MMTLRSMATLLVLAIAPTAHRACADSWQRYGMLSAQFAETSGDLGVGMRSTDIEAALDSTDPFWMFAMRTESEHQAVMARAAFARGEAKLVDSSGTFSDVELDQDLVEISWSWRFTDEYEVLIGARFQAMTADTTSTSATGVHSTSLNVESWVDPIVGARAAWRMADGWTVVGQFDIGGFGVASELTWSAFAGIEWTFSKQAGLVLGYRALDTDYREGSGDELFTLDALVAGPLLGIRFDFGSS
jgi:hypothetical protein